MNQPSAEAAAGAASPALTRIVAGAALPSGTPGALRPDAASERGQAADAAIGSDPAAPGMAPAGFPGVGRPSASGAAPVAAPESARTPTPPAADAAPSTETPEAAPVAAGEPGPAAPLGETSGPAVASPGTPAHLPAMPGAPAHPAAPAALPSTAPATHAGPALPVIAQVPLRAVPIEIALKSLSGVNRFEMRLEPPGLGRVEVRLEIGEGGAVAAQLVVDRPETLGLLQRDARHLERAFEQAGLTPNEGGIDLQLRDPGAGAGGGRGHLDGGGEQRGRGWAAPAAEDEPQAAQALAPETRLTWHGAAGVDLRI